MVKVPYFPGSGVFTGGQAPSSAFPDAEKILIGKAVGGNNQIFIADPDGTNEENISPKGLTISHFFGGFSRDGRFFCWVDNQVTAGNPGGQYVLQRCPFTLKNGCDTGNIIQISDPAVDNANVSFPLTISSDNDVYIYCAGSAGDRKRLRYYRASDDTRGDLNTLVPDTEFKLDVSLDEDENYIFMTYGQFETNLTLCRFDWDQSTLTANNLFNYPRVAGDGSGIRNIPKIIRFNVPLIAATNKTDFNYRDIIKYSNLTTTSVGTASGFDAVGNFVRDNPWLNETGVSGIYPNATQVMYFTNEGGDFDIYRSAIASVTSDKVDISNNVINDFVGDWLILPGE